MNDFEKILEIISKNDPSLKHLDIEEIKITDENSKALARALIQNTSLKSLNLAGCQITDVGAKALAIGLKTNTTLESLDFFCNNIYGCWR